MNLMDQLIDAVENRRVLRIDYHEPRGWRLVEPFCCGITTAGNPGVRVYQINGPSKSHEGKHFWKLMRVDRIVSVEVTKETFSQTRPGYSPNDKGMERIYADFAN